MADFGRKNKTDTSHLATLDSARYIQIDGSAATTTVVAANTANNGTNLLRVILNTNGGTITLRSGTRVVGIIALDAPEQTFNYGVYLDNGLQVDTPGAVDATVVFDR